MFNWLNFFYSAKFNRQYKFIFTIAVCIAILLLAKIDEPPKWTSLVSLGLGILLHGLNEFHQRVLEKTLGKLSNLLFFLPFVGLFILSYFNTPPLSLIYIAQFFGFALLGFILALTLQYRSKRH
ncbi:hypothetical protein [Acinetobacter sp. MD2(2019)]|uniref:hypothetical protein n=1 Tax=Acinetobacter sp. MD2(2019) TaxID=2605273 RepID=UPI002D1F4FF7|nr:hypothetical protein [Acinetobacter sp. MD2(2019)]MEB3754658.1 hypothetical protein [Acinetobacter sp. MD2(2019)]